MKINCRDVLAKRSSYSSEYDQYINLFETVAATQGVVCRNVPSCWCPFILYLGGQVESVDTNPNAGLFDTLCSIDWIALYESANDKRRVVEVASATRPELVHALYLADTEWRSEFVVASEKKAFPVTCNGSFFRHEVLRYLEDTLQKYVPSKVRCVIVPCAADKPYPSPLHSAVRMRIDDSWQIIIASGVLGLIPDDLWDKVPLYDSGVPNTFRCEEIVAWYFSKHRYERIICYSDFYANAISRGLKTIDVHGEYVFGIHYRDVYANLLLGEHLRTLETVVNG